MNLYRFSHIRALRAALRVKVFHLAVPVAVGVPTMSVAAAGTLPSLAEGGMIAAVVGGTLVAGSTLSWYCERLVGELKWIPDGDEPTLRVSTLTMWGHRHDRDLPLSQLLSDGFITQPATPSNPQVEADMYPTQSLVPVELCGKTYIFVWGKQHVPAERVDTLANLIMRQTLPSASTPSQVQDVPGTNTRG